MPMFKTTILHAIGTKIYKKDIIEQYNIRFEENWKYYEDIYFFLCYLYHCNRIYVQNKIMYYYRKDAGNSLSKQKRNLKYECIKKTYSLLHKFIKFNEECTKDKKLFYEMYLKSIKTCINSKIVIEKYYTINMHRLFKALSKDKFYKNALKYTRKTDYFLSKNLYFMAYLMHRLKFYAQIKTETV